MKKVSVIIPVYNGEKFIKGAIESVLYQTYKNIEIIIINDASTDNTENIIFKNFSNLIGKKIKYFKNIRNLERVQSRNKGIENSDGEYIFFLDYDDLWEKDYIQNQVKYLKDFDIVYSFPRSFIDNKDRLIRKSKKKIESLEKLIFSGLIGYPSATGIKRSKYIKYKEKYLFREDWEFFIRAYLKELKIKITDNDKVFMREHENRTSKEKHFYYATLKIYEDYINKIPERYLPYFMFHIGEICLRFGNLKKGWKLIFQSLEKNPSFLKDKRRLFSVLKRGLRFDRALKFFNTN